MNPTMCIISNLTTGILARLMVVAFLMVQSGHMAYATALAVSTSAEISEVAAQPDNTEREALHVYTYMQVNDEKPGCQHPPMASDCITMSCCFVVDDRNRSLFPLFAFGLSKYLNLNSLPSEANPAMVHERPPRTV